MKKDTFYFSHDYSTTSDPKIQAFLSMFGASGYGVFWRIIEMLHEDQQNKLPLKKYIYTAIGFQLKVDPVEVEKMIHCLIDDCEILKSDDDYFYSERVLNNMEKRKSVIEKRSMAGKRSAEKRALQSTNVKQKSTRVEQTPTKEIKENKSKSNKNKIEFDKLLVFFNETFGKKCRVFSASVKQKYSARVSDGYTTMEIAKAMSVCKNDDFHKQNNFKYCTLEYFARPKTLDQYAYSETKQSNKYTPTK
jgi:hypothetical protein